MGIFFSNWESFPEWGPIPKTHSKPVEITTPKGGGLSQREAEKTNPPSSRPCNVTKMSHNFNMFF